MAALPAPNPAPAPQHCTKQILVYNHISVYIEINISHPHSKLACHGFGDFSAGVWGKESGGGGKGMGGFTNFLRSAEAGIATNALFTS
jgi:hypothetical protein